MEHLRQDLEIFSLSLSTNEKATLAAATQGFWNWNTACQADNCRPCHTADPTTDTVKVGQIKVQKPHRTPSVDKENEPALATIEVEEEQASLRKQREAEAAAAERALQAEAARLEAERCAAEEAAARRREEEAQRREEEETAARRHEEEERYREEAEPAEEEKHRAQELSRRAQESDLQALQGFLAANGFKTKRLTDCVDGMPVNASKRSGLMGTTYPLHLAVKLGDAKMVGLLLANGAHAAQKDSSGKTPAALAERLGRSAKTPSPVLEVLRSHLT